MDTTQFLKKTIDGVTQVEPALTPPPAASAQTTFAQKPKIGSSKSKTKKREIPEGLWTKCPSCESMVYDKELDGNLKVCPKCQHHFTIGARERIHSLVETCTFEEMDAQMIERGQTRSFTGAASYKDPSWLRNLKGDQPCKRRRHHRHWQDWRTPAWRWA